LPNNETLENAVLKVYNPIRDHHALVEKINSTGVLTDLEFSSLRKHYLLRREFGQYEIDGLTDSVIMDDLSTLGFLVNRSLNR
jgi:hypothetical protein